MQADLTSDKCRAQNQFFLCYKSCCANFRRITLTKEVIQSIIKEQNKLRRFISSQLKYDVLIPGLCVYVKSISWLKLCLLCYLNSKCNQLFPVTEPTSSLSWTQNNDQSSTQQHKFCYMLNSRNNHNFTYLEELSFLKYTKHVTVFFFTIFLLSTELNIVCNITDK